MSQNTKYVISILGLLFIVTVSYSGFVIYKNKHNHDGSNFSIISLITGKDSTPDTLKKSAIAQSSASLNSQYNTPSTKAAPETIEDNDRRLAVLGFYEEYLANKQSGSNQKPTVEKYGTAKLIAQDYNVVQDYDPFICSYGLPVSAVVTNSYSAGQTTYFELEFSDSSGPVAASQLEMVNLGGKNLIDSIGCLAQGE